jgi:hypothetical protein
MPQYANVENSNAENSNAELIPILLCVAGKSVNGNEILSTNCLKLFLGYLFVYLNPRISCERRGAQ